MEDERVEKHESFGMIQIHRISGGDPVLFGSSIPHGHKIVLSIHPAELGRHLNQDWYHANPRAFIEIEMSYTQFAEAITSMNTEGVPVTVRRLMGKAMEPCPFVDKRQQFEGEFKSKMRRVEHQLDSLRQMAQTLADSATTTKGDRKALLAEVDRIRQEIGDNLPFTYSQFNEQMDKTVLEAKGEFEALVQHTIHSLGLQALKAEDFRLLAAPDKND